MNRLLPTVFIASSRFDNHAVSLRRTALAVVCACLFTIPTAVAHEGSSASHDHSHADTRDTPQTADTHETGTLPPARAATGTLENQVRFEIRDGYRFVVANGIPDHATGRFPNRGNPNVVGEQTYSFRIPMNPAPPTQPVTDDAIHTDRGYLFGIALNGVPFEPATGLNWTAQGLRRGGRAGEWVHEAIGGSIDFGIDHANAHVQRTGAYHYHGIPTPMMRDDQPTLLGYAADGYPIYGPLGYEDPTNANSPLVQLKSSWHLKSDDRPGPPQGPGGTPDGRYTADWKFVAGSGDLDRLNGRFAVTAEYPQGVYHYVLTDAFPHVPRGFAGDPDPSFRRAPGQGPNHVSQRGERLPLGNRVDDRSR